MSFVVYIFLCFSLMHACSSARPLGIIIDDNKENGLLIYAKDAKFNAGNLLISDHPKVIENRGFLFGNIIAEKLSIMEEFSVKGKLQAENGALSIAETIIEASKKIDDQEDKGGKRARSTLESPSQSAEEEEVNAMGDNNEAVEDAAMVMDYAQPHRKPPIHNK